MTTPALRLGTRGSDLALWQAERVSDLLSREAPMRDVEIVTVKTLGDRVQDKKISELGRTAVFTAELDRALLDGRVDCAVHSLKDVETTLPDGIVIVGVLPRGAVEDALVAKVPLAELPTGAQIGTGSGRRSAQVKRLRTDIECVPVRGNVPNRVAKVESGELDGLIMAKAGLQRLGLAHVIAEDFAIADVLYAVGQGAIAITAREGDETLARYAAGINHVPTWNVILAERACLRDLGAGCNVPLGVWCRYEGEAMRFTAGVFDPDGSAAVTYDETYPKDAEPEDIGCRVAAALRDRGADEILNKVRSED